MNQWLYIASPGFVSAHLRSSPHHECKRQNPKEMGGIDLNKPAPGVDIDLNDPVEDGHVEDNEDVQHDADGNRPPELPDLNQNVGDDFNQDQAGLVNLNGMHGLEDDDPYALRRTRKQYSDDTKRAVYEMLLEGSGGGRLPEGLSLQVSLAMDVSLRCVQRIWNEGQKGGGIHAVVNKRVNNCGRKRIDVQAEAITAIPLKDRATLRDLARGLGMATSTVFRRLKEGKIERRSQPSLTDENKRFSTVSTC